MSNEIKPTGYMAYANDCKVIAPAALDAATEFFNKWPTKRKCDISEGTIDGHFFTVAYGRNAGKHWTGITKKLSGN